MSAWPGKVVIGLTGNIATGKSVVRRMLEHLGAYGIDADALGHRAIAKGAPAYQAVIDAFGSWILTEDGQIDRSRLAKVVFADGEALSRLEGIVHPLVRQAVDLLVRRAPQKVIVIEAIKLLESPLRVACDSIWVTYASQEIQIERLRRRRGMSEAAAQQRLAVQSPHEEKMRAADVVIRNEGTFDETWSQVTTAWNRLFPESEAGATTEAVRAAGRLSVERARPGQAGQIAEFVSHQATGGRAYWSEAEVMAALSEKAFLLLYDGDRLVGMAGWQVENLVARLDSVIIQDGVSFEKGLRALLNEVERESRDLQCEVALLFLTPEMALLKGLWDELGYKETSVKDLGVRAWQEAALESMPAGSVMRVKQLRADRVLKPV